MPVWLQVVGLVLGMVLLQALVWVPLVLWLRARNRRFAAELAAELAASGETIVRGPESGIYRGATDKYGRVQGNGTMVLSDRRIIFRKVTGGRVEVPVAELAKVREARAFLGRATSNKVVILGTKDGEEVGFVLRDHAGWMALFRERFALRD